MRKATGLTIAGLLLTACVAGTPATRSDDGKDAAGFAKELAGLRPGKSMLCMPLARANGEIKAYGPTIVYSFTRSLKYVTKTNGGCEGIAHGDILVTRQIQAQPCSGDIASTIDSTSRFPTGSCTFGEFTEYRK